MGKADQAKLGFKLSKINDEYLAKLCKAYSDMVNIYIPSDGVTSLAPVAGLKGLQSITLNPTKVADLTPLAGPTEMRVLDVPGHVTTPDKERSRRNHALFCPEFSFQKKT